MPAVLASSLHVPRPVRGWPWRAAFVAGLVTWLALFGLVNSRLSLFERWKQSRSEVYEPAWPSTAPGVSSEHQLTSRPLLKDKQQQALALSVSAGSSDAATTWEAGSPKPAAAVQGAAESAEGSKGAGILAAAPTNTSSPPAPQGPFLIHSAASWDQRVSGLGPKLDSATLHGGWQLTRGVYDRATQFPNATVLSHHSPRVLLVHDFLAPEEVEHLIGIAAGDLARSEVVSDLGTKQEVRTSSGSWLNGGKRDAKVREIQHRIANLTGIPEEFGESMYVLRYGQGERYDAHTDSCALKKGEAGTEACRTFLARAGGPACGSGAGGITCGDRLATVIIYLRSPAKGGETVFPSVPATSLTVRPTVTPEKSNGDGKAEKGKADEVDYGGGDLFDIRSDNLRRQVLDEQGPAAAPGGALAALARAAGLGSAPAPAPSSCDDRAGGLRISPKPGDAVVFWSYAPKALPDKQSEGEVLQVDPVPAALHGGCPVLEGQKWIVTRWLRASEFH